MQFILHLDPQEEDERVEVYAREERPFLQELETLTLGHRGRRYLVGLTGQGHKLIPYSQAYLFFTRAKRVWVRTPQGEYPIRERLFELEEILDARHFVRISNSEIVNISQIDSLDFSRAGSITLQLKDGHSTYVSRRALARFKKSLGI